jgi:hypothetical protein
MELNPMIMQTETTDNTTVVVISMRPLYGQCIKCGQPGIPICREHFAEMVVNSVEVLNSK